MVKSSLRGLFLLYTIFLYFPEISRILRYINLKKEFSRLQNIKICGIVQPTSESLGRKNLGQVKVPYFYYDFDRLVPSVLS